MDNLILFIDDEEILVRKYKIALVRYGFQISYWDDINEGYQCFTNRKRDIKLAIIDILFPCPGKIPDEFNLDNIKDHRRLGEELYRVMNNTELGSKIPKIILTNIKDNYFHEKYNSFPNTKCLKKTLTLPSDLLDAIQEII